MTSQKPSKQNKKLVDPGRNEQVWQQCLDLAAGKMDTKDIASTCILDNMKEDEKK